MEISKIQEWKCHFPNMETISILEWIFYLPSLENGNNILFWIIYYPKLYFLLILSWILQFPFFSSPGYISVPGLEFVLTLTGYFLINQTWGNCIFSKLDFFLENQEISRRKPSKNWIGFFTFFPVLHNAYFREDTFRVSDTIIGIQNEVRTIVLLSRISCY